MSHHEPTGRDRSVRRGEDYGRNDPPRPHVSSNIESSYDVRDERPPNPPSLPEVHLRAPNESIHIIAPPPLPPAFAIRTSDSRPHHPEKPGYAFVRRSRRASRSHPDRAHDLNINDKFIEESIPKDSDYRMPSIQQNYRPPRSRPPHEPHTQTYDTYNSAPEILVPPEPIIITESVPHRRKKFNHQSPEYSYISSGDSSEVGGGGGGDIQISAAQEAEPNPKTLNSIVICVYRNSRRKFEQRRIWLVKKEHRHKDHFNLSHFRTDASFFKEIRHRYKNQLRGTFRRYISFKTVSTARILEYGGNRFGLANVNQKIFSPVFMKAYDNPASTLLDPRKYPDATESDWIKFFWLNRQLLVKTEKVNLAIELLEDYDPNRVMGAIAVALSIYFTLTVVWLAEGGDPGYVAGVMSFVLSILAVMVGLTGLYDWLDLGHMGGGKDFQVLDHGEVQAAKRDPWGGPIPSALYPGRLSRPY